MRHLPFIVPEGLLSPAEKKACATKETVKVNAVLPAGQAASFNAHTVVPGLVENTTPNSVFPHSGTRPTGPAGPAIQWPLRAAS